MESPATHHAAVAKTAVLIDLVVRCVAIAVALLLIREFWGESIPSNGDGFPVRLFVGPLAMFAAWNLAVIGSSIRRWTASSLEHGSFIVALGALSGVRLLWLVPLATDIWYRHHNSLMVLVAASVAVSTLSLFHVLVAKNTSTSLVESTA